MEVSRFLEASAMGRTIVEMGDDPYSDAIHKHLVNAHDVRPTRNGFTNTEYYSLSDDHRAALVDGKITVEQLTAGS